ncbi:FecR domain-containing protein [Fulvivirga maritima]|uniref:FecR family protein n=1 Tax=Fulvivirga maritima TaxID=2904247 RepID=UPI001F33BDCB|nr:FecR domain-containing protein [Fulvivirga maritima]UII24875.1 FecR domain-containing protein [Fulvivirga maritima]
MHQNHDDIDILISKYFAGEASIHEIRQLIAWINESEENKKLYHQLKYLWEETEITSTSEAGDKLFSKITEKIGESEPAKVIPISRPVKRTNTRKWYVAAAAVVLIGISLFWVLKVEKVSLKEDCYEKYTTKRGQKSKIQLPDGSVVWLNSDSELEYVKDFQKNREVILSGEAFFEVTKDKKHPFRVKTSALTTEVLGTSFNIKSFPKDAAVEVALVTGKVKIIEATEQKDYVLTPGFQLTLNKTDKAILKTSFDKAQIMSWKNGVIYFKDDDLAAVIRILERWYGVSIRVSGPIPDDFKVSGHYDGNDYLSNILNSIKYGKDFEYTIDEKNVDITFNP